MDNPLKCTLIGTVKDEGPYILEWITYYKLIGFNQIVIASNDCIDGTREMLDHLHKTGQIIHIENSERPERLHADPQNRAYQRAWGLDSVKQSDWVFVADADEFLNIHAGEGTVADLIAALQLTSPKGCDLVSAPWRIFGNAGKIVFEDQPVLSRFDRSAKPGVQKVQRYTAFKTLFRPKFVSRFGIHRPRLKPRFRDGIKPCYWLNGSGLAMPDRYLSQGWRLMAESYGDKLVTLNHYMTKSSEEFLMKRYRGTANSVDRNRIDFSYFETFNANDMLDISIQRHLPALRKALSELTCDCPELAKLHDKSIVYHRKKLRRARKELLESQPDTLVNLGFL